MISCCNKMWSAAVWGLPQTSPDYWQTPKYFGLYSIFEQTDRQTDRQTDATKRIISRLRGR